MHLKKMLFTILLGIPAIFAVNSLYSECIEGGDETLCSKQRGDSRCNDDSDCCSGRECDSFGYCTRRR